VTTYSVVFSPEAEEQLVALYRYIAEQGSPEIASRYTSAVVEYCEGLCSLPHRGVQRDDIRAGLRITHCRGRTIIAFTIEADRVTILGVFHGGRDYETWLASDDKA